MRLHRKLLAVAAAALIVGAASVAPAAATQTSPATATAQIGRPLLAASRGGGCSPTAFPLWCHWPVVTGPQVLGPAATATSARTVSAGCDFDVSGVAPELPAPNSGEVEIGWDHATKGTRLEPDPAASRCDSRQYTFRGGVMFDEAAIRSFVSRHGLLSATLGFRVDHSDTGFGYSGFGPCEATAGPATEDIRGVDPLSEVFPYDSWWDVSGANVRLDITQLVRLWATRIVDNDGLVVAGSVEGTQPDNGRCASHLRNFTLTLRPFR